MSKLQIISNNQPRFIISGFDLPKSAQKDFDYLGEELEESFFVKYLDQYYYMGDFLKIDHTEDFKNWDGYISDTFFSGILIKFCEDGDFVIMGHYYS